MSETGFKCPDCGQTDIFVAYELEISGPIDVDEDGYEPQYGMGLHYEIPDGALMICDGCGYRSHARTFRNACMDGWRKKEEK